MTQKTLNCNSYTISKSFRKSDPMIAAFTKTGAGTAVTAADIFVEVSNQTIYFPSGTAITMPTLVAGTDYTVWVTPTGTIQATDNATNPPMTSARKIGGFHYAPGSNATAQAGGNTTPQINEYSFWDLKFRPVCPDPRGMTLVAESFWSDIYLTGVDAITNGSSKYNVTIADGSSPPKIPVVFGGDGSATYGGYTYYEAQEMAAAFGKRCLFNDEFIVAAYGTTEASSVGSDQGSTILNAAYTSRWGLIQATGCMWVWGNNRSGPYAAAAWHAVTEGRGSEYNEPNASLFGGGWNNGSHSGSRCSYWGYAASNSDNHFGSRFACDHLVLGS